MMFQDLLQLKCNKALPALLVFHLVFDSVSSVIVFEDVTVKGVIDPSWVTLKAVQ